MNHLRTIKWLETKSKLQVLLQDTSAISWLQVDQGFEAEVAKLQTQGERFVMKVWNQSSKPDVRFQYKLLETLSKLGIPVSSPLGWGTDGEGHQVLLTTDGGQPVLELTKDDMVRMAGILSSIHRLTAEEIGDLQIPSYDFMTYFFPGAQNHADLAFLLTSLTRVAQPNQRHLVHGDFHMHNIVRQDGQFTVIDWTNAQWGDARYDFAWAFLLLSLYVSEEVADTFRSAYITEQTAAELKPFEALACLRWILLFRQGGVPIMSDTKRRVASFIDQNPFLKDSRLLA
ncbi:aminoglycoside phosphotransferase family protein [Sporosarcina sp. Te-1]|uniref:aminoglycoside phosphotransferase family protein n=1 Tax=Sporosarcina sp. Te-1 TaxID=2818390 RepID=UPI001A9EB53A|nr:aminoglycoside phosphotransferase family protein [Sporosarcina sp. Te-1]QTD42987.1 aminoglycoside phosphotransferase family protein [Sporosarcina sp. Te-1]